MSVGPPLSNPPTSDDRYHQAVEFLLSRINYERSPSVPYGQRYMKLDRMRQLLNRLGNPDQGMPIVHVAGTKGKGSTSAIVSNILQSSGYLTGLFSSPHLEHLEERFQINGRPCPADQFVVLIERLRPIVEAMDQEANESNDGSLSPTYFELTTALALMHFAEQEVDIAVLEVGMGGRLDSTNVCQPIATVITSISLDHTKQLGNTVAEIAAEKAGIIKPGVPVFCGPLQEEAREVIAGISKQHGSRMYEAGNNFAYEYQAPSDLDTQEAKGKLSVNGQLSGDRFEFKGLEMQLLGEHQAANAAISVAVCQELVHQGMSISNQAVHIGLAQTTIPARVEVIRRKPTIVLDVAHNVASAQVLVDVLQTSFSPQQRILVLAVSRDKDVESIVEVLLPCFDKVVLTAYQENPRAVPVERLEEIVNQQLERSERLSRAQVFREELPCKAWQKAKELSDENALICVTGSFFIAAELRQTLIAES